VSVVLDTRAVLPAVPARIGEVTPMLRSLLADGIEELRDQRLLHLLGASIESNVDTVLRILQDHIPPDDVEPPSAAFEHARRMAQHGMPVTALVRAYRLGQDHFLKWSFEEIGRRVEDPRIAFLASQRVVSATFTYIDWVSEELVRVYETERERWLASLDSARVARIHEIIDGRVHDLDAAEAALDHPLRQYHLGVVVWAPDASGGDALARSERFVTALGRELSCAGPPIFVPCNGDSGWAWLPLGRSPRPPSSGAVESFLRRAAPDLMIALGAPAPGLNGFRDTHRQALQAQRLALVADPCAGPVIAYADQWVRAAGILGSDLEQTRMLVRTALGPLACDDDYHARLRETLLAFLSTSSNYTTAAQLLSMHKNSVKYRVAKAEEKRGSPVDRDRLEVELALVACRWLGPAVLTPPGGATP
jgi:hypothetical protein